MGRVRPTLRVLREELKVPLPSADCLLDEIDHPLLAKASEQFADPDSDLGHERVRSIEDEVLFKVKVQRWRGAVWPDAPGAEPRTWLLAAGLRENGSPDDFYEALKNDAQAARKRYNAEHGRPIGGKTYVGHLLPDEADRKRYEAEANARFERELAIVVHRLVRASLLDGHEYAVTVDGTLLGVQVLARDGHQTYVAVTLSGKEVLDDFVLTVLELVPGCTLENWALDFSMPERPVGKAEQIWSTMMDPAEAARFLDETDTAG